MQNVQEEVYVVAKKIQLLHYKSYFGARKIPEDFKKISIYECYSTVS